MSLYKGEIEDFPEEIVNDMIFYQVMQGNPKNVEIFEENRMQDKDSNGFSWSFTEEGQKFWSKVIEDKDFEYYFSKFPK